MARQSTGVTGCEYQVVNIRCLVSGCKFQLASIRYKPYELVRIIFNVYDPSNRIVMLHGSFSQYHDYKYQITTIRLQT